MKKTRSSNLELLRIMCILFIIGDHFTGQSGIVEGGTLWRDYFYCITTSLSRVACSIFIIMSAWFSVDSNFKFRKIIHVWMTVIMYTVPIMLYCLRIGVIERKDIIVAFFPVEESPLWFAGYYIIIVFLSPILNRMISKGPKRTLEYILKVFFLFLVIYPTVTTRLGFFSSDIWALIFLYLLTGYIKRYHKINTSSIKAFGVFIVIWLGLTTVRAISTYYADINPAITGIIRTYAETYRARMQTIPNLLMAYSLFFAFYNLKVRNSKIINIIASTTLGVYVYHQVPGWYTYMWRNIYHSEYYAEVLHGTERMLYTVCCILIVFIVGVILELLRNKVSYILVESRMYCKKLCKTFDDYVNEEEDIQKHRPMYLYIVIISAVYMILVSLYSQGLI